jgi:hypothetical protein
LPDPLLLRIDAASVVANIGKRLYPHHTSAPRNSGDFSSPTAEIVRVDGGGVALMNCSTSDWSARADGQRAAVRPGQRVGLQSGLSVVFGSRTARVA